MPEQERADEETVFATRRARRGRTDGAVPETPVIAAPERDAQRTVPDTAIYRPRPAPEVPSAPPPLGHAAAPTREENASLPSVERRGRRLGVAVCVAFVAACVISVSGLVTLGLLLWGP